jgi:hypothetical protein
MSEKTKALLANSVAVTLSPNKSVFRFQEPVFLTARIENRGHAPIYVFPNGSFEEDGDGAFVVKVVDAPKCKATGRGMAGTPAPPSKDLKFAEWVKSHWLLLPPRGFLKKTEQFTKLQPLCPGIYVLKIYYLTELFWWDKERIQDSEGELPYPGAYGVYKGNTVRFRIDEAK